MTKEKKGGGQKPVKQREAYDRKAPSRPIGDRLIEGNKTTNSTGPKSPRNEKK